MDSKMFFSVSTLLCTLMAGTVLDSYAQKTASYPLKKEDTKYPTNPPERPKAPSRNYIYFSYDKEAEKCFFTLPSETEWMSVSMENMTTHFIYTGDVTSSYPVLDQSVDSGTYYVTCTTDDGDLYAGEVFID